MTSLRRGRGKNLFRSSRGFTLIELLLYITLASGLLFLVSVLFAAILQARVKANVVAEVEQEGAAVMQIITQTARNAVGINVPTAGSTSTVLSLTISSSVRNPTVFDLFSGGLRIMEGSGTSQALTSQNVEVSDVIFRNLARMNTSSTVRIEFRLAHMNPEGKNEYDYTASFYGSATIR